ncbi:MAG: diguanylate cyclase domain-containing protein [Solirubrobacteraceae bacterium]
MTKPRATRAPAPFQLGSARVTVGASVGVQAMEPGLDPDEVLRVADAQMYASKRAARGRTPS